MNKEAIIPISFENRDWLIKMKGYLGFMGEKGTYNSLFDKLRNNEKSIKKILEMS